MFHGRTFQSLALFVLREARHRRRDQSSKFVNDRRQQQLEQLPQAPFLEG